MFTCINVPTQQTIKPHLHGKPMQLGDLVITTGCNPYSV